MHSNRSLLPDVEVLLGVMIKTSRYSGKLLFVIINFYSRKLSKFPNNQNSEFWSEFIISAKIKYLGQFLKFKPNYRFLTKGKPIWSILLFCVSRSLVWQIEVYYYM